MSLNWAGFNDRRRLQKKASKTADRMHLTYSWLRADQASVQLGQLRRSHDLTPVCLKRDMSQFDKTMKMVLTDIDLLKNMIKMYEQSIKNQAGKK